MSARLVPLAPIVSVLPLAAAGLALLLGAAGGCARREGTHARVVTVLFDLSGSAASPDIRSLYLDGFQKILAALKPGDLLLADAINENPLAKSEFPVHVEMPRFNLLQDNRLAFERRVASLREEALTRARQLLSSPSPATGTSVIDATHLAARVFATYPDRRPVLVLFSDMVEQSQGLDLTAMPRSPEEAADLVAQLRQRGRVPQLHAATVYVAGAFRTAGGNIPPERQQPIKAFWFEFFRAAGADLSDPRWGSTLLTFAP